MSSHINHSISCAIPSINLPLTSILLKEWILVRLKGLDAAQCLHNQFTCDVKNLNINQYTFSAHCNQQGKAISNMYVFYFRDQEMAFIQKKDLCHKQITIMKKYAIFYKVTIIPDYKTPIIGIAGKNARQYLNKFFTHLPNSTHTIVHAPNATLLHFNKPIERFLLIIVNNTILNHLLNASNFDIKIGGSSQWTALDIEAEYPWIQSKTSEIFLPQAFNMDTLQGISFNKGCYIGQESIARMQYRGKNKKMLFQLVSTTSNTQKKLQLPEPGDYLELQIKDKNEKYIGTVLQCSKIIGPKILIQVILNNMILKYTQQQPIINTIQINKKLYVYQEISLKN